MHGVNAEKNAKIQKIAAGLPYRDFVTIGLLVNKLELKNKTNKRTLGNIVPDCWIYVQDKGVKLGRIQIFNNWSPYMVKNPAESVWIGLEYFLRRGRRFLEHERRRVHRICEKKNLSRWALSRRVQCLTRIANALKRHIPHILTLISTLTKSLTTLMALKIFFCVGRNGQHRYNNMDHSMLTSINAAKVIKSGSADKSNIWNVNTEKEYHESK